MVKKVYTDQELIAIGRKVVEAQERHRARYETMAPQWEQYGNKLRECRTGLGYFLREVAEKMGCSAVLVKRLEDGLPLRNRNQTKGAYINALKTIYYERAEWITKLDEIEDDNNLQNEKKDPSDDCV